MMRPEGRRQMGEGSEGECGEGQALGTTGRGDREAPKRETSTSPHSLSYLFGTEYSFAVKSSGYLTAMLGRCQA